MNHSETEDSVASPTKVNFNLEEIRPAAKPTEQPRRGSARPSLSRLRTDEQVMPHDAAYTFRMLVGMNVRLYPDSTRTIIRGLDTPASAYPTSNNIGAYHASEMEKGTASGHVMIEWKSSFKSLLDHLNPLRQRRESSLYWTIVEDESRARCTYHLCAWCFWIFSMAQLVIAAVLVVLGALPGERHISVATLGAVTGILTGALATITKQGLPNRALQYKNALRHVREEIEWTERNIRAGAAVNPQKEADRLRLDYNKAREDKNSNLPDSYVPFESKKFGHEWQKQREERAAEA